MDARIWYEGERFWPHRDDPVVDAASAAARLCAMADRYDDAGCPLGEDLLACLGALIRKKIRAGA